MTVRFNPPPGWPTPPPGWTPPAGWRPDPAWPAPPADWPLWIEDAPSPTTPGASDSAAPAEAPRGRRAATSRSEDASADAARTTPPVRPAATTTLSGETVRLQARIAELEAQVAALKGTSSSDVVILSDQQVLQDVGIYRYHHPLENAVAYKERLATLNSDIDTMVRTGKPVLAADMFTFDGSLAKGRQMIAAQSKLMLRAYNAEADNCVRSLRSGNVTTAKKRLESSVSAIARLGKIMEMRINPDFHALRVQELELVADYQMKVQEERERAREEREQLREQRKAEQELAAERERLDKERTHYLTVLTTLNAQGNTQSAHELQQRLSDIDAAIAQNDYRIANIRAGYVYVISNVGAFGPGIVKVGLTRRLEPRDRVHELGNASVPFRYDIHALYFSKDAVTLETELHHALAERRVNFVNPRREFFFATPGEVRNLLQQKVGDLLEFTEEPEASEYFQSRGQWPASQDDARP